MPVIDEALIIVSYGATNLIVSWIDDHSGDKTDGFAFGCMLSLHQQHQKTLVLGNTEW